MAANTITTNANNNKTLVCKEQLAAALMQEKQLDRPISSVGQHQLIWRKTEIVIHYSRKLAGV